ncbi:MAG: aldehyde dehydrogenase family protein [Parasphingorhabdus sp.]|uniref:aldehyde dehydrogenase family protein n=1 Tax=Parasphingorhabdus sp. TaxID=2709688 RepID=UPI003001ACE9
MLRNLIGGALLETETPMDVINPVDETVAGQVAFAGIAEMDQAVAAAKAAFASWRATSFAERKAVLQAISKAISDNAEELGQLLIKETGRPIGVAQFEVQLATQFLDYAAEQVLEPEILFDEPTRRVEAHRNPLGVVAAIVPWNAPLYLAANKIGPALIAGNTIVVKPAPTTPLTTLRLGELIADIVPAGVINIISADNDAAAHAVAHEDVAKIAFTGSTETGRKIMAAAAPGLKKLTLELGGNDAAIVLPDADVKAIAPALFGFAFFNSGQVCAVIKRLYVHDSIYDALCTEIAGMASAFPVGDGADPAVQFGPIQNKAQYEKVLRYIDIAKQEGRIIAGGEAIEGAGYFVPLTVVADISDGAKIVDEEPFGPILPIIRYSDVDEVIARANASPFGLGGSVWSADVEAATAVANRLDSGTIWVNQHCALDPAVPFPTSKQSGLGVEGGREGLYAYTNYKIVNIAKGDAA